MYHTICFPQSRTTSMENNWQITLRVRSTAVSKCKFTKKKIKNQKTKKIKLDVDDHGRQLQYYYTRIDAYFG